MAVLAMPGATLTPPAVVRLPLADRDPAEAATELLARLLPE